MVFDIGAGLSEAGKAVEQSAGQYLTDQHRADLDQQKIMLADQLQGAREEKQRQFTTSEREATEKYQSGENVLNRENTVKVAGIGAGATVAAAAEHSRGALAVAIQQGKDALERYQLLTGSKEKIAAEHNATLLQTHSASLLTPEAARVQAENYVATGKVAGLRSGSTQMSQVMSLVPDIMKEQGLDDPSMRAKWSTVDAAKKTLENETKLGSLLANYSQTLHKNIQGAEEIVSKGGIGPSGVPVLDRWIQAGRKGVQGDAQVNALDFQLKAIATEVAKLNTGQLGVSGLPEGARAEYERIIGTMTNKQQLEELFKAFTADSYNRLSSQDTQIQAAQQAITKGVSTPLTKRVPGPAGTPSNPTPTNNLNIPTGVNGVIDVTKIDPTARYNNPRGGPPIPGADLLEMIDKQNQQQ